METIKYVIYDKMFYCYTIDFLDKENKIIVLNIFKNKNDLKNAILLEKIEIEWNDYFLSIK